MRRDYGDPCVECANMRSWRVYKITILVSNNGLIKRTRTKTRKTNFLHKEVVEQCARRDIDYIFDEESDVSSIKAEGMFLDGGYFFGGDFYFLLFFWRPFTYCQAVSENAGSYDSCVQCNIFYLLYMRPLQWWLKTKGFSPR